MPTLARAMERPILYAATLSGRRINPMPPSDIIRDRHTGAG